VVIAPERAKRPGADTAEVEPPSPDELEQCPFCEDREDRTPPETFALAPPGRQPDSPGWQVRVVPNLFPAFEHQEVVVHTPRHARSFAELTAPDELAAVASVWHRRIEAARNAGSYPFLFVNEGGEAGASLPHSHSQVAWLREPPPEAAIELPNLQKETCALCSLLRDDKLEIALAGDNSLRAAQAGRVPYELLIAPERHEAEPDEEALVHAVTLLHEAIRRLRDLEGPTPFNAWHHTGAHWHLEIVPRLTVFAGLELGAGLYVNWLPPEEAAKRLR
jgi:UDPglucose--hexose-1-phosphate uridylyltransferase